MTMVMAFPPALGVAETGIQRVAVIGAGAMGAGIAAQFANAGMPVDLLDIRGSDSDPDAAAKQGIARQLQLGGFMHASAAAHITPGNITDHLQRLAAADWIVEAVIEKLEVKRALYAQIDAVRKADAIISSNTSTILRADLVAGLPPAFAANFFITHFFNPPRQMQLAELVSSPQNDAALAAKVARACEALLGKTVIACHDTPGFIANRIGCYWMASAILQARQLGLTPEQADAAMVTLGVPKTGVFGLADLVGLDLVPHVWGSLMASLPKTDALHAYDLPGDATIRQLISAGRFGRKAKAGFYRMNERKQLEVIDFATGDYRPAVPVDPKTIPANGPLADYAQSVLNDVLAYATQHASAIADEPAAIDVALELGYGWRQGVFKQANHQKTASMLPAAAGKKSAAIRLAGNAAATLWDMGDGVARFEIHTKLNSFAPAVFDVLEATFDLSGQGFSALVLGNDDPRAFSAGADLSAMLAYINEGRLAELDAYIARGQQLFHRLRFSAFPVVAAMHGLALGGGCEFGLHANRIVAHAELNAGLPEVLVGLVPGWGGCTQLLVNAQTAPTGPKGPVAIARTAFQTIVSGQRSGSALEARANGILRHSDRIVMHRASLLSAAKAEALQMLADDFTPPEPVQLVLSGPSGKSAMMTTIHGERAAGRLTDTDLQLAETLAGVLTGGPDADLSRPMSETDIMRLEREALVGLAGSKTTADRIAHMLQTGKPLRN